MRNKYLRILIASVLMLTTIILIELLFEGNILSVQSNPVKTLFTAVVLGIAIVVGQELMKEM